MNHYPKCLCTELTIKRNIVAGQIKTRPQKSLAYSAHKTHFKFKDTYTKMVKDIPCKWLAYIYETK